jgi:hypothetical protein
MAMRVFIEAEAGSFEKGRYDESTLGQRTGDGDHKVIASLPGRAVRTDDSLRKTLCDFILGVFTAYPEVKVEVGDLLPREAAIAHIARNRAP